MILWRASRWAQNFWGGKHYDHTGTAAGAKAAKAKLAALSTQEKNRALLAMAQALVDQTGAILEANAQDLAAARGHHVRGDAGPAGPWTRPDPEAWPRASARWRSCPIRWGRSSAPWSAPTGWSSRRRRCPWGVIAIIYESRPNVTSDAAALALKSGNVCVLGGQGGLLPAPAIVTALKAGLTGWDCRTPLSTWWRTPPARAPPS